MLRAAIRSNAEVGRGNREALIVIKFTNSDFLLPWITKKRHDCWLCAEGAWLAEFNIVKISSSFTFSSVNIRMLCLSAIDWSVSFRNNCCWSIISAPLFLCFYRFSFCPNAQLICEGGVKLPGMLEANFNIVFHSFLFNLQRRPLLSLPVLLVREPHFLP